MISCPLSNSAIVGAAVCGSVAFTVAGGGGALVLTPILLASHRNIHQTALAEEALKMWCITTITLATLSTITGAAIGQLFHRCVIAK
jgi:hypothetical protein